MRCHRHTTPPAWERRRKTKASPLAIWRARTKAPHNAELYFHSALSLLVNDFSPFIGLWIGRGWKAGRFEVSHLLNPFNFFFPLLSTLLFFLPSILHVNLKERDAWQISGGGKAGGRAEEEGSTHGKTERKTKEGWEIKGRMETMAAE